MNSFLTFQTLALLCGAGDANVKGAKQLPGPTPKMLEDVYGPAQPHMLNPPILKATKSEDFRHARDPSSCHFPLDVVIVQDTTASFSDDFEQMKLTELDAMIEGLKSTHPDSRYGLLSFKDKPLLTLGETYDYCHRVDLGLTATTTEELLSAYGNLWPNGGQDPAENQFGALIAAAESSAFKWSVTTSEDRSKASKLFVLATDAWPHFDADGLNNYGLTNNTGHLDHDEDTQCRKQYYPNPDQVHRAISAQEAYVAFLIFDSNWANGLVKSSWEWFNTYIGQSSIFLEPLAANASNFWSSLSQVIVEIEHLECGSTTSSTTIGTTSVATTTVPPTTSELKTTETQSTRQTATSPNDCGSKGCCPEVVIKLRHRPDKLHLDIENNDTLIN